MSWKTPQKRKGVPTLFSMIVGYKNIDIRKQKNFYLLQRGYSVIFVTNLKLLYLDFSSAKLIKKKLFCDFLDRKKIAFLDY